MICSKSAAHALVLPKQDSTNGTHAVDVEQIMILLANNAVNKLTEAMTCSKSTANGLESCKQDDTNGLYADNTGQIETDEMTSK